MVFQKKGGAAAKRSFQQVTEKIPKKKVFEAEEEEDDDDDDLEDDSDLDDSDSGSDASDSGNATGKMNAKGKQALTQLFVKTTPKGQIQSSGLPGKKNQLALQHQKLALQARMDFLGKKNQGKGKMIEKGAAEAGSDEEDDDDDDDDDDLDDDDDNGSGNAGGKVNAKGKQTPQGKSPSLTKTPQTPAALSGKKNQDQTPVPGSNSKKGQAQTPALQSGKKNQVVTPSQKQAKQNTMKEFPGMKGSAKKSLIRQQEDDDDDDEDDDDDDDDDTDDSSDDAKHKTPSALNKSSVKKDPNDKKDMHVSFELPQKGGLAAKAKSQPNTPAQAKKNQLVASPETQGKSPKQTGKATPGKEPLKGKKKSTSNEDEDMEDDDDDDDDDMDEDEEDDDDDSEEEEDDDEDDDDDDDDEEEEQEAIKKKIASLKQDLLPKKDKKAQNELSSKLSEPNNKKSKTLLKNQSADSKAEAKTNKPAQNKAFQESLQTEIQRKRERDARNLFIRGLPPDVTVDEIKSLSPDILDVSLPKSKFQKKKRGPIFGFLEFANEKKAEENYVKLQKKKLRGQELFIDYSGEKSKNRTVASAPALNEKNVNKKKLFVSALPADVTISEVAQLFPHAYSITVNNAPEYRNSSVSFHTEEDAAEAFKAHENPKIRGRAISVLYAIERLNAGKGPKRGNKRPFQGKQNFQPTKKMRM